MFANAYCVWLLCVACLCNLWCCVLFVFCRVVVFVVYVCHSLRCVLPLCYRMCSWGLVVVVVVYCACLFCVMCVFDVFFVCIASV